MLLTFALLLKLNLIIALFSVRPVAPVASPLLSPFAPVAMKHLTSDKKIVKITHIIPTRRKL